jgi:dephospho-CoA kinase
MSNVPGRLLRVALTGGIATGKSHCLRRFAGHGVPVIDADVLAREAVQPGGAGIAAVAKRFGASLVRPDGSLDRARLGSIVFRNPAARRDLEAIVHPFVYRAIKEWFADCERTVVPPGMAMADIPLLYETGRHADFDVVVVVACSPDLQRARVIARDGISGDEADRRIRAQLSIEEKRRRADHVIDTSGSVAETDRAVDEILDALREAARTLVR